MSEITAQLREKGVVTRARLGAGIQELTPKLASALSVKASKGAVVLEVVPDGPAAKAGLKQDDVIVSLNGKDVDSRSLRLALASMTPGTTINLKVLRDGNELTRSVTLDTMPNEQRADDDSLPLERPRARRRG